jgi:hypothetical protein
MEPPARMPFLCPACQRTLYSTSASRPQPATTLLAIGLFAAGGAVASFVYLIVMLFLRDKFSMRIADIPNSNLTLYRTPPTALLSVVALPIALVPGFAIGWLANRLPKVRRLRCWSCRWSARYPANSIWERTPE